MSSIYQPFSVESVEEMRKFLMTENDAARYPQTLQEQAARTEQRKKAMRPKQPLRVATPVVETANDQ